MQILIATHNQSKLIRYQKILASVPNIELVSLTDLGISKKVEENHATNTENALEKARIYGELSGLITVAADEALMTNFLPDNEQPGVYARRFSDKKTELTDHEVIDVWEKILKLYPQPDKQFIWNFAVAFYNPATKSEGIECVQQISHVAKHFSDIVPNGYPMSSFMSPDRNGNPYSELNEYEYYKADKKNFAKFIVNFSDWLQTQNN